jgi:ubiquinone/menaquinone biosynthesis C-methylase UbiE
MGRHVRLGELYLGTEGAALFRHLLDGDDEFAQQRRHRICELVARIDDAHLSQGIDLPEMGIGDGYAAWAPVYDTMPNALIRAEEQLVRTATQDLVSGRALDVACGTGRHAAWLCAAGHATIGIDATAEMLDIARDRVPDAQFQVGDFNDLPFDDGTFDFAICALALAHASDPSVAIREIARAVRPGGRIVLTDAHPTFVLIQGQALFPTRHGLAFIRNYPHPHGTYLRAFRDVRAEVIECLEAPMETDFTEGMFAEVADAAAALWEGIPAALLWSLRTAG